MNCYLHNTKEQHIPFPGSYEQQQMISNTQKIPEVKQKPFVKWGEGDNWESVANESSSTNLDVTNQVPGYYGMGVLKEERLPLQGGIKMSKYFRSMSQGKHVLSLEDSQSQEAEEWVMLGNGGEERGNFNRGVRPAGPQVELNQHLR